MKIFFFFFGILPYWFKVHKHLSEILGCWALTFPNVGWIGTLRALGDIFNINAFFDIHAILAAIMFITWVVLFGLTALAFFRGKIFFTKNNDIWSDSELGLGGNKVTDGDDVEKGNSQPQQQQQQRDSSNQGMELAAEMLAPGFRASMAPSASRGSRWMPSSSRLPLNEPRSGWYP
ncbi:hypothetical protein FRC03_003735 [Tulasnella sp. 419]|nr:hypothetical protein FRC03_003735 [Tulasnella sp. 419]